MLVILCVFASFLAFLFGAIGVRASVKWDAIGKAAIVAALLVQLVGSRLL